MKIKNEYLSTGDYYLIRSKFNGIDQNGDKIKKYSKLDRAAAFMILNKTCFNGLYRVNKQGLFNVPKGRYKTPSFMSDKLIKNLSRYFMMLIILHQGFTMRLVIRKMI